MQRVVCILLVLLQYCSVNSGHFDVLNACCLLNCSTVTSKCTSRSCRILSWRGKKQDGSMMIVACESMCAY